MTKIIIKKMTLINFKGIRSLEVDFSDGVTSVSGRNGSGKTTLFDAFTWVLFGKDSRERKAFDVKTIGADGQPIPRLPHEVTVTLMVDAEEVTLTRRYSEKWVKPKGSSAEKFTGHEEERLYNDVPCSVKDWNEKISGICQETVFKFITSPSCFASQKPDAQRTMLIRMAGGFSDNEVIAASGQRQDFIDLLGKLCGKSMEEYKREIQAKKRRIKAEIEGLPERIDERNRDNAQYSANDYAQLQQELEQKQQALADIDAQLTEASAQIGAALRQQQAISDEISADKSRLLKIEADIKAEMAAGYYQNRERRATLISNIRIDKSRIEEADRIIMAASDEIQKVVQEREQLRSEYKKLNGQTLSFAAGDFVCPTCGQALDPDNIEKKKAEMAEAFNARKSAKIADNITKGMRCNTLIEQAQQRHQQARQQKADAKKAVQEAEAALSRDPEQKMPTQQEVAQRIAASDEHQALQKKIAVMAAELDRKVQTGADTADLKEARQMLADGIAELKAALETRNIIERNNARIAQLQQQLSEQSDLLAELEGIEFSMTEFAKARVSALEGKINSLFKIVRFKMFGTQVNGGEVETCEATVGGVPYSSLNNAMRINAGLDIINAICRHQGIAAPIFIDNAESVLEPMQTIGQQVRLIVADKDLTIN